METGQITIYNVVVIHHKGGTPNYEVTCETFLKESDALIYKMEKDIEYPTRWGGDYNHVKIFKKTI